jgi:hypothetical protein
VVWREQRDEAIVERQDRDAHLRRDLPQRRVVGANPAIDLAIEILAQRRQVQDRQPGAGLRL